MYSPKLFKVEDVAAAYAFMDRYPFATAISVSEGKAFVSHLPLTPQKIEDHIELVGHLSRANEHWQLLRDGALVTVVFHGPHGYITPKWYENNDVPTWNYSAVHISGKVNLIESHDGIVHCLTTLTGHLERLWPSGWAMIVPEDLSGAGVLEKSIVGFRVRVNDIEMKKKLSQNRSATDRAGVLKGLATRDDALSQMLLEDMREVIAPDGSLL